MKKSRDGFLKWYKHYSDVLGLAPDPYSPLHFYDWEAAYNAGASPDIYGHWPSEYKLLGHPNLIVDGIDTRTGELASPEILKTNSLINYITNELLFGVK